MRTKIPELRKQHKISQEELASRSPAPRISGLETWIRAPQGRTGVCRSLKKDDT